jgi:hypothetical protein
MSFLAGRASFLRFATAERPSFGQDELDKLAANTPHQNPARADGVSTGWAAGKHELDLDFALDKNLTGECLVADLRLDSDPLPASLLRAYYEIELRALSRDNPSGFASAKQKREARASARNRLEEEASDGRFKRRKCTPWLWDRTRNEVLFGATSLANVDRFCGLFERTFSRTLECLTAGALAEKLWHPLAIGEQSPTEFWPGASADIAWIASGTNLDWLGNEFLLWLWFVTDTDTDTISETTLMFARTLTLECPRGQTGHETFNHEGPTRLPEAKRAIQSGKLPRRAGFTMVRADQQYEFALSAEAFAISGAKLPQPPEGANVREHRVEAVGDLLAVLDGLYSEFLAARLGNDWNDVAADIRKWLGRAS